MLDLAQPGERNEGDEQEQQGAQQQAVDAGEAGRLPAQQAAADLADREEDRVQAHDRAAVLGIRLRDIGQQAQGGGRRTGQDEQAAHDPAPGRARAIPGAPSLWLITATAAITANPPRIPKKMIEVRR